MLADFFTKPLQGSLFERFRQVLMGHAHISTLSTLSLVPIEERVEGENRAIGTKEQGNQDPNASDVTWAMVAGRTPSTRVRFEGSSGLPMTV